MVADAKKAEFAKCEEKKPHEKVSARVAEFDAGRKVMQISVQKGFRWTECMKEKMGTDSCQAEHFGILMKGQMKVEMIGGNTIEVHAGEPYYIPPGHDALVVEDVVMVEFSQTAVETYGKDIAAK